ncbi:hypothetical protein L1987_48192 [Smallanthus sonchifolius]|uniref:Uncharacterized protein n=1 Tax=Smallanthus sonchifolius TaxID=185202 RepID=A0ACB9FRC8_9ASTR|nr:hypothetical protein L1987_48192 [Smallanthus sonchifolius]
MLKLARLLHHKGLHVTFINTQSNDKRLVKSGGTCWLNGAPGFQFKTVPDGLPSLDTPVTCIVSDGVMTFTKTPYAAEKLGVPIILHWTVAACGFIGFYQAKVLMEKGLIPVKDLVEFGWGLVNSNHYFLWIVRTDLIDGKPTVLPPELEKEWVVGMEIGRNMKRDEVEKHVRELMEGVEGARVRKKAMEWKKMAEISTGPNGSSSLNMQELVTEIGMFSRN